MSDSEINVLHLMGGDLTDGASRGTYWLHLGLLEKGIKSKILTDSSVSILDDSILCIAKSRAGKVARFLRRFFDGLPARIYFRRKEAIFSSGLIGYDFTQTKAYAEATIIHLHWINGGFVNLRHLRKVKKPIVWTFRDMWPVTGGCHVAAALGCERYKIGCGLCPQLGSLSVLDLSRFVFMYKKKYIPVMIHVVGISPWLSSVIKDSSLFKYHDVHTISNNIDTRVFSPIRKSIAKSILDLPSNKIVLLSGTYSHKLFYKGYDKYRESLSQLDQTKYHLLFFGSIDHRQIEKLGFEYTTLGVLYDSVSLRLAYSAANVFIAPSLMEAFGKTIVEAMACGTPVVCFDTSGQKDIVDHMVNGYKAIPFESKDLANGIEWVSSHPEYEALSVAARNKSVACYDSRLIAGKYIELYKHVQGSTVELKM